MVPEKDQSQQTRVFAQSHTMDSEEGVSLWGKRVAPTRWGGYWSLEDRAMLTSASWGRSRDQGQGWEFNQHLARSGPNLQSDVTLTV